MGPTNWMAFAGRAHGRFLEAKSSLYAVDRGTEGKLLWNRNATDVPIPKRQADAPSRSTGFEGTPGRGRPQRLCGDGPTGREQTATYVACLDADIGVPAGALPSAAKPRRKATS